MDKLKIEYVDINSIRPYRNNAKQHPKEQIEQIKKSIEQFGMDDPIGVWKDEIVEGHGRLLACKELGYTEVPIIRLDHLSDEERKAYTLAHNKLTMNSDFDLDILQDELDDILNIDMSDFGFEKLVEEIQEEEVKPEIEFSEVLGEEHNYIVLYFDNEVDWLQAETLFDIKPVKCGSTRKDGILVEANEFYNFIEKYSVMCDELGFKFWGLNCNQDALSYRQYSPFSTVSYIGGPFQCFLKNDLRYDERLPLKEDYDMTLQQCNKYRGCLRINKFFYSCKQSKQAGGCATYRNYDREIEQLELLQRKWGKNIVKIDSVKNSNQKKESKKFDYNPIIKIPIKGI